MSIIMSSPLRSMLQQIKMGKDILQDLQDLQDLQLLCTKIANEMPILFWNHTDPITWGC